MTVVNKLNYILTFPRTSVNCKRSDNEITEDKKTASQLLRTAY